MNQKYAFYLCKVLSLRKQKSPSKCSQVSSKHCKFAYDDTVETGLFLLYNSTTTGFVQEGGEFKKWGFYVGKGNNEKILVERKRAKIHESITVLGSVKICKLQTFVRTKFDNKICSKVALI